MAKLTNLSTTKPDAKLPAILEQFARYVVPLTSTPEVIRNAYRNSRSSFTGPEIAVDQVETIAETNFRPRITIYRPQKATQRALIFLHGGGWVVGDLETYDRLCRRLAEGLKINLVYVHYRLAPEHPFPAPLHDSERAAGWVLANAEALGFDPTQISIGGDSAGGNLAAVLAVKNRAGRLGANFSSQLLIYPCLDLTCRTPSHRLFAEGYSLTGTLYQWYIKNYLRGQNARDWQVSPAFAADLSGMAKTVILYAGFDILRDEGIAYAEKLRKHRVPVFEIQFPEMIHGFMNLGGALWQVRSAVEKIAYALEHLEAKNNTTRPATASQNRKTNDVPSWQTV